jgi:hypothetical protein
MGETFSVGDSVTVIRDRQIVRFSVVATVGKRKLVLKDGSEWTADGERRWGCSRTTWYTGPWIRHAEEGDAENVKRRELADRISSFGRWNKLSTEALETVARLIAEAK